MDTNNLDTHMYLLVSTASSWLQNKHPELIKTHKYILCSTFFKTQVVI